MNTTVIRACSLILAMTGGPWLAGCNLTTTLHRGALLLQAPGLELTSQGLGTQPTGLVLGIDALGNVTLEGNVLQLPKAQEDERVGVMLVDLDACPRVCRPDHAREGGVMTFISCWWSF